MGKRLVHGFCETQYERLCDDISSNTNRRRGLMMNTMRRNSERGGARLKFIIVLAIIGAVAYAGFQIIPVFYRDYQISDLMQHDVDTAVALGKPTSWVKEQL